MRLGVAGVLALVLVAEEEVVGEVVEVDRGEVPDASGESTISGVV